MFQQQAQSNRVIPGAVATVGVNERVTFLRKTYGHLAAAVAAFVAIEYMLLDVGSVMFESVTVPWFKMNHFIVLAVFMGMGYIGEKWARSETSRAVQYMGLAVSVCVYALVFSKALLIATLYHEGVIADAAILTGFVFSGLTATVFLTKKDFSFMRGALSMAVFGMLGMIVASILFGFSLGMVFTGFGILVMSGYVLYYTSNVLHHYRPTQYVGASLALFSALAMLFYYILIFAMQMGRD
ncbi:MAG: permease [Myxococcales bacterium]|nr:permease [Myxococcales bacterium]